MNTKIIVFLGAVCVVLFLVICFAFHRINSLEAEKIGLKTQIEEYEKTIKNYEKAKESANDDIQKIKTIVKTIKEPCDCYNAPIPDQLLGTVRGEKH